MLTDFLFMGVMIIVGGILFAVVPEKYHDNSVFIGVILVLGFGISIFVFGRI